MTQDLEDSDEGGGILPCSVCEQHTPEDKLGSQQVLFRAVDALGRGDMQLVADIYPMLTNWDAHCAVSVILNLLMSLSQFTGVPASVLVERYRGILSETQQHQAQAE